MHRSGTSVLTNVLHQCGMSLGDPAQLMPPKPDNPDGFFEHLGFVELNTDLLQAFGGDWDVPPELPRGWEAAPAIEHLRARGDELLAGAFGKARHALWKDPRNSLTLPFWRARGAPLKVIVSLRGPVSATRSLQRRSGHSLRFGLRLWAAYYRAIASALQGCDALVVHHDALRVSPLQELGRILQFTGVQVPSEAVDSAASLVRPVDAHELQDDVAALKEVGALDVLKLYDGFRAMAGPCYAALPEALDHPVAEGTSLSASQEDDPRQLELVELRAASVRAAEVERWLDAQLQAKLQAVAGTPWPQEGLDIDFRSGGNAWRHVLYGWSVPEAEGCWTDGHGAAVAIPPVPKSNRNVLVRVHATPYLPEGTPVQNVRIRVGARELHAQDLHEGCDMQFVAPRSLFPDHGSGVIHFDLPHATQPAHSSASRDRRRLGILVRNCSMTLTDAAVANP
jgi:hypothetical protein